MLLSRAKPWQSVELTIDSIVANPDQPRKNFDPESLAELADSIKEYGVLQPIIVRKMDGDKYFLVAGERRYRAAQLANQKKIPAIIKTIDDQTTAIIALTENLQRENLTYFEEALAYAALVKEFHLTQMDISKMVGKQQSTISNKMRLLSLPAIIKDLLVQHNLTERHARALLSIKELSVQEEVLQTIIAQDLNINQTEKLIATLTEEKKDKRNRSRLINYKIYVNTLKKAFSSIKEESRHAEYFQTEKDDHVEVRILIPKAIEAEKSAV